MFRFFSTLNGPKTHHPARIKKYGISVLYIHSQPYLGIDLQNFTGYKKTNQIYGAKIGANSLIQNKPREFYIMDGNYIAKP